MLNWFSKAGVQQTLASGPNLDHLSFCMGQEPTMFFPFLNGYILNDYIFNKVFPDP